MNRIRKIALSAVAGLGLLGASTLFMNKNPISDNNLNIDMRSLNEQQIEANAQSLPNSSRNELSMKMGVEEGNKASLEDNYNKYILQGFVYKESIPLQGAKVNAGLSSLTGVYSTTETFSTRTDSSGKFVIHVPSNAPYTVEARHKGNMGQEKAREVTAVAEELKNARDIVIKFNNSPDILVNIGSGTIKKATVQIKAKKSLDAIVNGDFAFFEDVEPNRPYHLVLETSTGGIITDEIPVFDEDVTRKYNDPGRVYSEIFVVDKETKKGIEKAELIFMLPEIDKERFTIRHTTNDDGIWNSWMSKGNYFLRTQARDYCESTTSLEISDFPSQTNPVKIELKKGKRIDGRVIEEDGNPVNGAMVYLLDALSNNQREDVKIEITGNDGRFTLTGIDPNKKPPYSTDSLETFIPVAVKEGYFQSRLEEITLTENKNYLELQIKKPNNTLEGRVISSEGYPVQSFLNVQLRKTGGVGNISNAPFWINRLTESNLDGNFSIKNIPSGIYKIIVRPKNEPDIRTVKEVEVPSSEQVLLRLNQGIPIVGHVRDKDNGMNIEDVNVRLYQKNGEWELITRTDNNGTFRSCVPEGEIDYFAWLINNSKNGAIEEMQGRLYPVGGGENYNTILFERNPYLRLEVTSETGNPIQLCEVLALENRPNGNYATSRTGFSEKGLVWFPLRYPSRIFVSAKGYETSEVSEIKEVKGTELKISMKKSK